MLSCYELTKTEFMITMAMVLIIVLIFEYLGYLKTLTHFEVLITPPSLLNPVSNPKSLLINIDT